LEMREYLDTLVEQIRFKKARELVEEEVKSHIEDQMEAYRAQGMTEAEAEERAVRQMGDPVEAGVALDRVHRPGMDWRLVGLIAFLSLAGLAVLYVRCGQNGDYAGFWKQCIYIGVGFLLMMAVCLMDYSAVGKYAVPMWCGLGALILIAAVSGPMVNGARYYIRLSSFHMEIKNYIYLYVPIYAGILYRSRGGGYLSLIKCGLFHVAAMLVSLMAVTLPICLDVTAVCLILTSIAIWNGWFAVRRRNAYALLGLSVLSVPALLMGFGLWRMYPYQIRRIQAILNPYKDSNGAGYLPSIIRETLKNGSLLGQSGEPVADVLKGVNTDYVLTHLVSTYGYLAAVFLVILFALLLLHIFHALSRQKNQLGQMIGLGCGFVFALQLFHGVMLNLGIGFMTVGIPFLSNGQSVTIAAYLLMGMLLSIYRYKDVAVDKKASYQKKYRIRIEKI